MKTQIKAEIIWKMELFYYLYLSIEGNWIQGDHRHQYLYYPYDMAKGSVSKQLYDIRYFSRCIQMQKLKWA